MLLPCGPSVPPKAASRGLWICGVYCLDSCSSNLWVMDKKLNIKVRLYLE